ncbi:unnamed protein product [Sphagnum troendelagicum]|uniref:HTH psq-type domain-containing protein n=1 Tax=Sphagnum troendelagicum TaxID=128251 RepID=A0ABP0TIW1_9BRYO
MGNWTEETMRLAVKEVKTGNDSMHIIGEKYNIPASSIRDWISGKMPSKKKGPCTVLSQEEEHNIVDWKKKLPWLLPMTPPMMHPMCLPLSEADGFAIVARDRYNGHSDVPTLNMQEAQYRLPLPHIQSAGDMGIMAVNNGIEMSAGMGIGM